MERARKTLGSLHELLEGVQGEWLARELQLGMIRQSEVLARIATRSDLIRASMELLLAAAEKLETDLRYVHEYAAVAAERTDEDHAFAQGARKAAAARWGAE